MQDSEFTSITCGDRQEVKDNGLLINIIGIIAVTFLLGFTEVAECTPLIRKLEKKYWIPNTTIKLTPQASALAYSDPTLYFALTGGLGEYNVNSRAFSLYFITDDDLAGDITSLALVNDHLWVATRGGIHLFDIEKKSFVRTLTSRNSPLGADNNISLLFDEIAQELYVMSFEHLQKYILKSGQWEDLNHLYKDFNIGEPAGNPFGLLNETGVWIASGAHAESRGGLFFYHRNDKTWTIFRGEPVGQKSVKRIDIDDMLLSPMALYVLVNDRVARYEILQRKWESFSKENTRNIAEEIRGLFPHLRGRWTRSSDNIMSAIGQKDLLKEFREVYFTGEQVIGLNPESFSIFKEKKPGTPIRYTQTPLLFKRPLGSDGKSKAIFLTNRGIESFDASTLELKLIKNSEYFIDKEDFCDYFPVWKDAQIFLLFKIIPDPEDSKKPPVSKIFLLDLQRNSVEENTPKGIKGIEDIFLYRNTVFCNSDKSLLKWKNRSWIPTNEKVKATVFSAQSPVRTVVYSLKGGKKIEFNPSGLFVY